MPSSHDHGVDVIGSDKRVEFLSVQLLNVENLDPTDPAANLGDPDGDEFDELSAEEREDLMEDLGELEVFQVLLAPRGIRGLVIDCQDCQEPHYFDWDLLRGNLRHLLDSGRPRVPEPAYDPDPDHYVSWEYARGYSDAVADLADGA